MASLTGCITGEQDVGQAESSLSAENLCLVPTDHGSVKGVDSGTSCAFLGIPYAANSAGANRWREPQPRAAWAPTILAANTAPAACPQIGGNGLPTGSEDCLKLNVWVSDPPPASPAPVIFWIHTGAFQQVNANFAASNGRRLVEETGAIVVEANYRLGPFGFLAHTKLTAENPAAGNYGLLDQRAALEWVQDNIAAFGGDPGNVTIAGTSAGGHSVGLHMVSPGSSGLFQRAIMESSYGSFRRETQAEAEVQGAALATALGCTNPAQVLTCMRGKTINQVLQALPVGTEQAVEVAGRVFWNPVVDGVVIPDQPRALFEAGQFEPVPTILGEQRDEGWVFVNRSFAGAVTAVQFKDRVIAEFGDAAADVLAAYPLADFATPKDALARVYGDAEFRCEARRVARLLSQGGVVGNGFGEALGVGRGKGDGHGHDQEVDTFLYSFEYEIDDQALDRVIHGTESNIIFGNNFAAPSPVHVLTAADNALHAAMAGYWTRFAATGNPNDGVAVEWADYSQRRHHIIFDTTIRDGEDFGDAKCELWDGLFLRTTLRATTAAAQ